MKDVKTTRRFLPILDPLDGRQLLSGVTASLAHGVLSVRGTSPSAPIRVDILAVGGRHHANGALLVEGVGSFPAAQVRRVRVVGVAGEAVAVANPNHVRRIRVQVSAVGDAMLPGPAPATASLPATTLAAASTATTASVSLGTMSPLEQQVVDLTNQARVENGLPALQVSSQLVNAAQTHSRDMAQWNDLDHDLPGAAEPTLQSRAAAVGYNYSWLGENIAFNYPDGPSVLVGWMNSPGHRANILNPNFTQIGVGIAWNRLGQPYYTQEFGKPA